MALKCSEVNNFDCQFHWVLDYRLKGQWKKTKKGQFIVNVFLAIMKGSGPDQEDSAQKDRKLVHNIDLS